MALRVWIPKTWGEGLLLGLLAVCLPGHLFTLAVGTLFTAISIILLIEGPESFVVFLVLMCGVSTCIHLVFSFDLRILFKSLWAKIMLQIACLWWLGIAGILFYGLSREIIEEANRTIAVFVAIALVPSNLTFLVMSFVLFIPRFREEVIKLDEKWNSRIRQYP